MNINTDITGVILAGGQARRMQGDDKGLLELSGKPMIEHVLERIKPQTGSIIISANRNLEKYSRYGYPVLEDTISGYQGPLAGILSAMIHVGTGYIFTVPCDTPYLPRDLLNKMLDTMHTDNKNICVAFDGQHIHPVIALISCELKNSLEQFLKSGQRKAEIWVKEQNTAVADFSDCADAFVNINTYKDKDLIEKHEH
jgi:molybdenum cofactor guanylyltransferase